MESRVGRNVPVTLDLSSPIPGLAQETADMRAQYAGAVGVRFRTQGPRITYNCHGFTFSSGRGWIVDDEVRGILQEDDYIRIAQKDVMPGDVILYISPQGDPEHSGRVISYEHQALAVPLVVSKWGKGEEIIHPANRCEYDYSKVEFWRLSK